MRVDSLVYPHIDIIGIIEEPQLISGRGQYSVPELDGVWGCVNEEQIVHIRTVG